MDGWKDGRMGRPLDGRAVGLMEGWDGRSFDGSMVNGAMCECGCMVNEYVVDG